MTHAELVHRAVLWLYGTGRCSIAFSEFSTGGTSETPDAIGFSSYGSTVIECKRSRSDFFADLKKPHRRFPNLGMGQRRFYMTTPALVRREEVPEKWGLLEVNARHVRRVVDSGGFMLRDRNGELAFLVSMLRRTELRAVEWHKRNSPDPWPVDFLNRWLTS